MNIEEKFWKQVKKTSSCWEWVGGKTGTGYGAFSFNDTQIRAHRFSYESKKGKIPKGLHIDHLCRNRGCVNPKHLEAVTRRENILRGTSPTAINFKRTECKSGHVFDKINTRISREGKRRCRMCDKIRMRNFRGKIQVKSSQTQTPSEYPSPKLDQSATVLT